MFRPHRSDSRRRAGIARTLAIVWLSVLWTSLSAVLWTHPQTYGREGVYLDLWSIPHLLAGALSGATRMELAWTAALAVAWELVEARVGIAEHATNQATDVVLALAGWAATTALWSRCSPGRRIDTSRRSRVDTP